MYVNKCIKCGAEFETKNPKRVICPDCLYAEKSADAGEQNIQDKQLKSYSSYPPEERRENMPRQYDNRRYDNRNNRSYNNNNRRYDNRNEQRGFNRQGRYNNNSGGGYNNNRFQGYGGNQGNRYNNPQRRNNNRFQQGGRRPAPQQRKQAKPLLISKEQLEMIEAVYKTMLPLPNPDAHEIIGANLGIEPRKVFFGINLVRQKLMLPKLPYPKRKLAVTPDQMTAVKSLYSPLLPLPPIGCHKIIAAQLKVDEWRVHVAIKLIRAQMGLDRWNEDRPDKPADYLVPKYPQKAAKSDKSAKISENDDSLDEKAGSEKDEKPVKPEKEVTLSEVKGDAAEKPPKRGRKKKAEVSSEEPEKAESPKEENAEEVKPKKRGRKPKKAEDE